MKSIIWSRARFVASAPSVDKMPLLRKESGDWVPEVALLGRSNVGKSSLLNSLFQLKALVKTSSTPGKTQSLNLFAVDDYLAFVDLPGYGYAAQPDSIRREWAPMVRGYIEQRQPLKAILWLLDIRRTPGDEERALLQWFFQLNYPFLPILTKMDQIAKGKVTKRCQEIREELDYLEGPLLPISTRDHAGRAELIRALAVLLTKKLEVVKHHAKG